MSLITSYHQPALQRRRASETGPRAVDHHIAQRIRRRRTELGITQTAAGLAIGWQVHSVRALITATIGRKMGNAVVGVKEEGRGTVYRIA